MDSWYGLILEFLAVLFFFVLRSPRSGQGVTASAFCLEDHLGAVAALPVPHNPVLMMNGEEAFPQYD